MLDFSVIRAILLDLGKVIIPFDFLIGYREIEARCGLPPDLIRDRIRQSGLVAELETGRMGGAEFVERVSRALELDIQYDDFCEIWSSIFGRETLLPESLLASLHERYRLVLVSNTNSIHFDMIRRTYGLLRHFDAWILSYEVGAMKPSPVIYEAAVRAAGVPAADCFFTDDMADYVEGAREFGIDAVQFESCEQLVLELRLRGVQGGLEPIEKSCTEV